MLRNIKFALAVFVCVILYMPVTYAQDTTWQQVLDGWVDDVYYENLFLGGSYYTRISLVDIDNDGDLDMFYGGGDCGSHVYFENVGNPYNPIFELGFEEFPGFSGTSYYGGTRDIDFADLDNDGDFDAAYSSDLDAGGTLRWNDGTPENPYFVFRYPLGPLQGQSNVTLVDIDNDGDYDYFSGQGFRNRQMYYCENVGTPEQPSFDVITYHYQNLDFGVPFNFDFGDLDEDGDYDLIVCKHGGNIAYFENIGTPDSAYLYLVTDNLLPDRDTTDWMETPELSDIDNDGDLDLFLAGAYAHLFFFENIGADSLPRFIEQFDTSFFYVIPPFDGAMLGNSVDIDNDGDEDLFPGVTAFLNESFNGEIRYSRIDNFLPFVAGALADLDADGDFDYVVPGVATLGYYENIGDSSWPIWATLENLFPPDGIIQYIYTVTAGDLDYDGDYDLLIGHQNATSLSQYRNDGTPAVYNFTYAGQLNLPQWVYRGSYDVILDDIDNDDDLDLLVGDTRTGNTFPVRLILYRNDGTAYQPFWTYVTDDFQDVVSEHREGSITPSLSDVDNDGDKDLVMTNNSIGMQLFLNPEIITDVDSYKDESSVNTTIGIKCFPNPSNIEISLEINVVNNSKIRISILNILGQEIERLFLGYINSGPRMFRWNCSNKASGIYFVRVSGKSDTVYKKITLIK